MQGSSTIPHDQYLHSGSLVFPTLGQKEDCRKMSDVEATPPIDETNPIAGSEIPPEEPPVEETEKVPNESVAAEHSDAEAAAAEAAEERREGSGLEASLAEINQAETLEAKLQLAVDFMERTIAQTGAPHFKSFWELRKLALELFKGEVTPALRAILWGRYTELTKEARRLKEILDEQTAFAVEQIDIAIKALEDELGAFAVQLEHAAMPDFGVDSATIEPRIDYYRSAQRELQLLNAQASRINALRKELIKTEMRVRQKNKFFQRLSAAGDHVFPRRKDLIKEVSENFIGDVEAFVTKFFTKEDLDESLFFLREEIKSLQTIAKLLTLNTRSFTQTRTRLSECWEKVKQGEKERKKERTKKKAIFRQHAESLEAKIQEVVKAFAEGSLSVQEANKQLDSISVEMRSVELGRDEVQAIRDQLQEASKPIRDKVREGEANRKREEQEREQARHEKVESLRLRIDALLNDSTDLSLDAVVKERDAIVTELADKSITRTERMDLERRMKPTRDLVADKRAKALMFLSQDDQNALQGLREVHKERVVLRQEIKAQLENYRKALGGSGLDFEQAMQFNEQQRMEKERLEKAEQAIHEIEEKIAELEAKVDN